MNNLGPTLKYEHQLTSSVGNLQQYLGIIKLQLPLFLRVRACNASRVLAIVCPSVRPSVALQHCIKQMQARITKSSLWVAARTLVYRDKIFVHLSEGVPIELGRERGVLP